MVESTWYHHWGLHTWLAEMIWYHQEYYCWLAESVWHSPMWAGMVGGRGSPESKQHSHFNVTLLGGCPIWYDHRGLYAIWQNWYGLVSSSRTVNHLAEPIWYYYPRLQYNIFKGCIPISWTNLISSPIYWIKIWYLSWYSW